MKKKTYIAPFVERVEARAQHQLLGQSTWQDDWADARENGFLGDDDEEGIKQRNLWDD